MNRAWPTVATAVIVALTVSGLANRRTAGAGGDGRAERAERARPSRGCRVEPALPGVTDRTTTSGGVERRFQLQVPAGYDGRTALPVVLGLHALTVSYLGVPGLTGFPDMAARFDFIGIAPSGRADPIPYWLAAPSHGNHDVTFIGDLLDLLEAELCVDRSRVYATGMSNGAQMSSLLACRLGRRFAAVAPVAGVEFSKTCAGPPVAVMAFHGHEDPIVTYDGEGLDAKRIADVYHWRGAIPPEVPEHRGVDAAMRAWADHNGCDRRPVETRVSPEVRRRVWRHCDVPTVLYVVDGGGHAWPGKPVPQFEASFGHGTTEIDASTLIFDFFLSPEGGGRLRGSAPLGGG